MTKRYEAHIYHHTEENKITQEDKDAYAKARATNERIDKATRTIERATAMTDARRDNRRFEKILNEFSKKLPDENEVYAAQQRALRSTIQSPLNAGRKLESRDIKNLLRRKSSEDILEVMAHPELLTNPDRMMKRMWREVDKRGIRPQVEKALEQLTLKSDLKTAGFGKTNWRGTPKFDDEDERAKDAKTSRRKYTASPVYDSILTDEDKSKISKELLKASMSAGASDARIQSKIISEDQKLAAERGKSFSPGKSSPLGGLFEMERERERVEKYGKKKSYSDWIRTRGISNPPSIGPLSTVASLDKIEYFLRAPQSFIMRTLRFTGIPGLLAIGMYGSNNAAFMPALVQEVIKLLSTKGMPLNRDWRRNLEDETLGIMSLEHQKKRADGTDPLIIAQSGGFRPLDGVESNISEVDKTRFQYGGGGSTEAGIGRTVLSHGAFI